MDREKENWKKFLAKDNAWGGLHLIIDDAKAQSFYTSYKLPGLPDYILIDQSGNIVNMKASRPSQESCKIEIEQLLAKVQ